MNKFTYDENILSDLFKEAHGFRPSPGYYSDWGKMSDEEKQQEWDYLIRVLEENTKREELEQAHAAAKFEQRIADYISLGASDRETAIRWIADSEECINDGVIDTEHLEWKLDLSYGYLKK
jgi:hypothetical protein